MSATLLWGASKEAGALQPILDVNDAPILDVNDVPITSVYPEQILGDILDIDGSPILDVSGLPIQGIVSASVPPDYWQTAEVTTDGGVPFGFLWESNPWQPSAQGGENVFAWAFLTFSWSMAATVRIRAFVDGSRETIVTPNGSVAFVDAIFTLEQQTGTLQRLSRVLAVPLVRALRDAGGVGQSRFNLRGERLQLAIASSGPLGVGELQIDGCEIEYAPLRKASYPGQVVV